MNKATQQVRHESRRLIRELGFLQSEFGPAAISHQQCHSILEIGNYGSLTALDLTNYLNLDKSTVSRIIKQLKEAGMVNITASPLDKRKKNISLTKKGEQKYQQINSRSDEIVTESLSLLSAQEIETVIQGLAVYAKALNKSKAQREFTIRQIQKSDNASIAEIIHTVMPEFGCDGPGFAMRDPEVRSMYQAYNNKQSCFLVLEHRGKVVGGGGIAPLENGPKDTCELKKMYFLPEARGTGMGKELLQQCLIKATELGYKHCYLETTHYMTQAQALYTRLGFTPLKQPMGNTGHHACDRWYLKPLNHN